MAELSPKTNADLQRLRRANVTELSEALRGLLDREEALDQAAEILEERIRSGDYVTTDELARLLSNVKRRSLFDLVRDQLFQHPWALITLYRGKYPDQSIEQELADLLYRKAKDDSDPARRAIAEAMCDVVSAARDRSANTLESPPARGALGHATGVPDHHAGHDAAMRPALTPIMARR